MLPRSELLRGCTAVPRCGFAGELNLAAAHQRDSSLLDYCLQG